MKDAEEEAVMCNTATIAGAYGQMANSKYISSSEDRKLALKHYKNKQDMLKVSNPATVWSCNITDEHPQMCCLSRMTVMLNVTPSYMQQVTTIAQLYWTPTCWNSR